MMAENSLPIWLGRHHPELSRWIITGWIRTTTLDTSTVVTAVLARACVMALQVMTTPWMYRMSFGKSISQI